MSREITDNIKHREEVKQIIKSIEERIVQLCEKFETGNCNMATLPAFFLGVQGDIDYGLKKAKKIKQKVKKKYETKR